MNINTILIVVGEPNSTFSEILFKYFKSEKFKNLKKIVLIGNIKLLEKQMKILGYKFKLNKIIDVTHSLKHQINIINIDYIFNSAFTKISDKSNKYIVDCFNLSLNILKKNKGYALINGPISKKHFLKKKFPGITEYVSSKTNSKNPVMLIYNKNLSVSPLTTHIPLKKVANFIKKKKIVTHAMKINDFYISK